MADTPATKYSDTMTKLVNNAGGAVQQLPEVTLIGGRVRRQLSRVDFTSDITQDVVHVARVPKGAALQSISVMTDTSLGTAELSFGDAHDGNSEIYGAAATLTATDTLTRFGPPLATFGVPLATVYDHQGNAGGQFEDILMTIGTDDAPTSGGMVVECTYTID